MITPTKPHKTARTRDDDETLHVPILVVDDVQDNRELLEELLRGEGYEEILSASSGIEALSILEARPDVGLVLLDLMMPGMDGYETCWRISGNEKTAHIPIIVVTGGALRRDEALLKSFERGAMDFIPKPVNEVELYGRVKSALLLYRERVQVREKTQALAESQERYELAVNGVHDGIWDLNLITNEIYYSPQWKKILGYGDDELPNIMGVWENIVHPEDKDRVLAAIHDHWTERTPFYTTEHRMRTKTGDYKWVFSRGRAVWDEKGNVVRMAGSTTDITQRKMLEAQLRQAQQMESVGRLAAGIAHDFNNLLGAILGHASLIQLRLPANLPVQANLDSIQRASVRAAELCKQMLAYAGQGSCSVEPLDVNVLIADTLDLLQISISKKITFDLGLARQPLMTKADAAQIRQVFMNLIINAAEAIGDDNGMITILSSEVKPSADDLADAVLTSRSSTGNYVQVEVIDSGCGMSKETIEKIFQPFFTTKFAGRGLGLSAVLGIVQKHDGILKINSHLGQGTSFKILLPCLDMPVAPVKATNTASDRSWHGSGTILLLDDEIGLRESTEMLLQELGFKVLVAEDGKQGLEIFLSRPDEITAVVCDLTMPRLNGADVFEEIHRIRPHTPILLASGYTEEKALRGFRDKGVAGFIQKPFEFRSLAEKLKNCLAVAQ